MTGLISSMNTCAVSDCKKRKQGAQVGMAFSRHAVNTSMYAHRQPSLAVDGLENAMPTCYLRSSAD